MTVAAMVNWLILLEQDKEQKCPKLFSRVALGKKDIKLEILSLPTFFKVEQDLEDCRAGTIGVQVRYRLDV
jgi:hypothetical protein